MSTDLASRWNGGITSQVAAPNSTLTIEKLRATMRRMADMPAVPVDLLNRIVVTSAATKHGERLFPFSRHRSARIRKKLIKRHGGEFAKLPAIYKAGDTMLVHPALAKEVIAKFAPEPNRSLFPRLGGVPVIWSGR